MAKPASNLTWTNIDINSLPEDLRKHYDAYKAAYAAMKQARELFETETREALAKATPKGKRVVFGYNFGKLSYALADDDDAKAAKPAANVASFGSLLK